MSDFEKLGAFYLGREYDPAKDALAPAPLMYDSRDLTTHAVCVGMTGSGKTGLCVSLLEEAALDGIPALVIDPKGDIANLMLTFPGLTPAEFEPWIDPAEAARKGATPAELAAKTAETWKNGLAEWGQDGARIRKFRESVDVAIYTPGSNAGLALSVLRSFAPPAAGADPVATRDRIAATVAGLLGLVGIAADPLKSREHILLSAIVDAAWSRDRALDLAGLIGAIQKPPFEKVGVFDVETFYPAKERLALAMAINNLLASPGFGAWLEGEPLDVQRLLFTPEGKPRISIVSIAHLTDAERMFVVTLIANELVAWMRQQPGTGALRAVFYMDEIFGYFPPSAMPPSKLPMLTLMKQARAFGLGVVLATQNPVDLDYKGLSNAGTWFIGRLQTERDQQRVIDGLSSALAGPSFDRATLEKLMAGIAPRVFLMRNVHDDAPVLFRTRWAMSWLRGPLTLPEITRLMAGRKAAAPAAPAMAAPPKAAARPVLPAGVQEVFLAAKPGSGELSYRPRVVATAELHYADKPAGVDAWTRSAWLAPLADGDGAPAWDEAITVADLDAALAECPVEGAAFGELPAAALSAKNYDAWSRALAARLYQDGAVELLACKSLKLTSNPGESEGDFRARLAQALREHRDAAVTKLREKHAPKLQGLENRIRTAEQRVEREKSQYSQRKLDTAISIGTSVLGAIFGGRSTAATRAGSAARHAGRVFSERGDIERAGESLEALAAERDELLKRIEQEAAELTSSLDPAEVALERIRIAPRKSDIAIGRIAIAWEPWRAGADGFPRPTSTFQ
ncbi:MAG: helicase HerA domain-containing protein [Gammaproteobacteria bacterium]